MTNLTMINPSNVDTSTLAVRLSDGRVAPWYSTTQAWAFDGGDAIVVVTGYLPDVRTYVVLRRGGEVRVLEARSIVAALEAWPVLAMAA